MLTGMMIRMPGYQALCFLRSRKKEIISSKKEYIPGHPVVKTAHQDCGFNPWSGN